MNLSELQKAIADANLDGWLFFDHHHRDALTYRILGLADSLHVTRRWYYFIPAHGEPRKLVHRIEAGHLDGLPGTKSAYSRWQEHPQGIAEMLGGAKRIAMQYSPECAIFYVSLVDAGTIEIIRKLGVEVVSSVDLIQHFEARWTAAQLESHLEAGRRVDHVRREAFDQIAAKHRAGERIGEYDIQQFISTRFREEGLVFDSDCIVAVNEHASNPHYSPDAQQNRAILEGDSVLIDMWAKLDQPDSTYYDITWMGFCGDNPDSERENIFAVLRDARNKGAERVQTALAAAADLRGFNVDDAVRAHIDSGRLRPIFHPSHRPLDRHRSPRVGRQHGQFRTPRHSPRHPVDLLLDRTRHLHASRRHAQRSECLRRGQNRSRHRRTAGPSRPGRLMRRLPRCDCHHADCSRSSSLSRRS